MAQQPTEIQVTFTYSDEAELSAKLDRYAKETGATLIERKVAEGVLVTVFTGPSVFTWDNERAYYQPAPSKVKRQVHTLWHRKDPTR